MDIPWIASGKELPVLAGLIVSLFIYAVHRTWSKSSRGRSQTPVGLPEKTLSDKEREPGEWSPVNFNYPLVEANKTPFSAIKPIPYRPFKWGDYHVTMGIRNMAWDEWIELDREFPQFHKVCEHRIRTRGDRLLQVRPAQPGVVDSGHAAVVELVYELAEWLSRRHPDVYQVTRCPVSAREAENGWYGAGRIRDITVIPFHETYNLERDDPLKVARMLMQEDFTLMLEGTDGRYYLQAGAVCIPGMWRLEDKLGMPLEDIHLTGHVPQYKSKLQLSMSRFFRRMSVDKPVVRNNYGFQVVEEPEKRQPRPAPGSLLDIDPDELAWSATMNGDEDTAGYERAKGIEGDEGFDGRPPAGQTPATPATFRLRTERQTLRRLPRTGAIVFTIRVYQTPMVELVQEPGVPGRMASAIRSWPEDVARYKTLGAYEAILPYLDECHAEQVEKGIVMEEGNSKYPC